MVVSIDFVMLLSILHENFKYLNNYFGVKVVTFTYCNFFFFLQDFKTTDWTGTGAMTALTPPNPLKTSNLSLSEPQVQLDWTDDAQSHQQSLMYKNTLKHKCIHGSHVSSVSLSDLSAAREGSMSDDLVVKMIDINQVNDGVDVSYTGDVLTLEKAFQCGLIPASVYVKILQGEKSDQEVLNPDATGNMSALQSEDNMELCDVNRLILKCLNKNTAHASGRNFNILRSVQDGLSHQGTASRLSDCLMSVGDAKDQNLAEASEGVGDADGLRVDAAVQCDLMSSSSTLVVLGHQEQFIGLVLPHTGETVSTSLQYREEITTSEFTTRLLCNRRKIAAFYIPESSEVINVTSAVQEGLIDTYTAEFLKAVEIPDVFPDVDHLSEKFSSWLTHRRLTIRGSEENPPTPGEAEQFFLSYLMINSFIDPKSAQRVLILDSQLVEMTKNLLEHPMFASHFTQFTFNSNTHPEQMDVELSLHINEETEELVINTPLSFDPPDFVSKMDGRITFKENTRHSFDPHSSAFAGNIGGAFDENSLMRNDALKQEVSQHLLDDGIHLDTKQPVVEKETIFESRANWRKSGDSEEIIYGNTWKFEAGDALSEGLDIPSSLQMLIPPTSCSANGKNLESPSKMIHCESSVNPCHQIIPDFSTESQCRESENFDGNQSFLSTIDVKEAENKYEHTSQCLQIYMEQGENLNITSGTHCDWKEALNKEVVDEQTMLKLVDPHSEEKKGVLEAEKDTSVGLKQDNRCVNRCQTEQQTFLKSDCNVNINEPLQFRLVHLDDLDPKISIYPEEKGIYPFSEDHNVDFSNMYVAENAAQPTGRKVAVMMLDLANEEADNREEASAEKQENMEMMSKYQHSFLHLDSGEDPVMTSPSTGTAVTTESVRQSDKTLLLVKDSDSHVFISAGLKGGADVCSTVLENAAPTTQSGSSSLSDRSSSIITDSESQDQHAIFSSHSYKSDSNLTDVIFSSGYETQEGIIAVNESERGTSRSSHSDLVGETKTENDTSAVLSSLDREPAHCEHYSSPGDVAESAVISVSRASANYDINSAEDGNKNVSSPQAVPLSENDFIVEYEPPFNAPTQSVPVSERPAKQPETSSQLNAASDDMYTTNTVIHRSCDTEDPAVISGDFAVSNNSGAEDVELDKIPPQRQHNETSQISSDTEETFVLYQGKDNVNGNVSCSSPTSASSDNLEQHESKMGEKLGSPGQPEEESLGECVSEHPHVVTNVLSATSRASAVCSSAPSVSSDDLKTVVDDQQETIAMNVSGSEKARTEDNDKSDLENKGNFNESKTAKGVVESSHSGPQVDVVKQNSLNSNGKDTESSQLIHEEERDPENSEQSDVPNIQLQLLQLFKTVSSGQDFSVIQEMMDTLSSALGGDVQEDRRHILESIKEESSEGEDEESAKDDLGLCHAAATAHQPSAQVSDSSDVCKAEKLKNKVRFILYQCCTISIKTETSVPHLGCVFFPCSCFPFRIIWSVLGGCRIMLMF